MSTELVFGLLAIIFFIFGIYGIVHFFSKILKKLFKKDSKAEIQTATKRSDREGGITYRQEDFIFSLGEETGIDVYELALKRYDLELEELSIDEASNLIDYLLKKQSV